ncbi:hypothetical protein C7S18_23690 (plasmid) [Ahniella affigens]|uniref:Conjugal transfer protein TraH n=1 Tax=Ahniella affigens TaxID=2021234 RepID=A0A2P1PZN0_9GAMM|nr:conjugal transfer protein TraH [Ahniella affigens]AVQ00303.1 hypothetical protein C7S18_23690 [Ahniella affigens]
MIRTILITVLWAVAQMASAQGMDTQLETTFQSMSNTTNPQFINEGRPTVTMGSFSYRTPVTRPQILSFDPPRFSGGCGGIDLYGGSFSFISKEELQGLMRQIAANAKSYAFNLALGAVCNKCLQEMQALQDKVQKINQMMKSSCDIGQALVNSAADPAIAQMTGRFREGAQAARQGGSVSDLWESMNQGWGKESTEAALAREQPDEFARIQPGNVIWRLLKERGVSSWFEQSDDQLAIDIQSFLGTVIVCAPSDASACMVGEVPPEDRPSEVTVRKIAATLDLDALVFGSSSRGGGVAEITCGNTETCLDARVEPTTRPRQGLKTKILRALVGDPDTGDVGYIKRYRSASASLSPVDQALRSNAPGQMGALDRAIDQGTAHAAMAGADVIAELIALELVDRFLSDVLQTVRQGGAQVGSAEATQIGELLEEADRKRRADGELIARRQHQRILVLQGLGAMQQLGETPDMRAGSVAPAGN